LRNRFVKSPGHLTTIFLMRVLLKFRRDVTNVPDARFPTCQRKLYQTVKHKFLGT